MSKLDDIIQEHGEAWLRSQNSYKPNSIAKEQIKDLMLELIGDMEERETEDMALKSWSKEDYKAFGRNDLRSEMMKKVSEL